MSDTIFDKILRKEIPARVVYEDADVFAFHDISPQAPVHVLVIPKHKLVKFADIAQAPDHVVAGLFKGAAKVAELLGLSEHGYRVVSNCGKDGGQTVDYLHLHILGKRRLSWPPG